MTHRFTPRRPWQRTTRSFVLMSSLVLCAASVTWAETEGRHLLVAIGPEQPGTSGPDASVVPAEPTPAPTAPQAERPSHLLPFWAEEARKRGHELPLTYGLSPTFTYTAQDFSIRDLKIGLGNAPPTTPIAFLGFDPIRVKAYNTMMRFDAWVLPFLNVYGLAGYSSGKGDTTVTIPAIPTVTTQPSRVPLTINYEGPTYGGGMTLAGGYDWFFATVDVNFTLTDLRDAFTSDIKTFIFAPRLGWHGTAGWFKGGVWAGTMYMNQTELLTGTAALPSGLPLNFELKQQSIDQWNALLGFMWEISPRFVYLLEGGLGPREQVTTSLAFRF
ncbi:hypothetical protein ACO9S2_13495 [Nitrospira sp. NS4]|uniref:hypothetical protein n=1 Tax=Nitrospira sp. NS4 TaxID=3414498 RepID=UPI003C2BC7AB